MKITLWVVVLFLSIFNVFLAFNNIYSNHKDTQINYYEARKLIINCVKLGYNLNDRGYSRLEMLRMVDREFPPSGIKRSSNK